LEEVKGLWVPVEILSTDLKWNEKAVLALINSLSSGRPCTASTNYMAELLRLPPYVVKNCIRRLKEKKIIDVKIYQERENAKRRVCTILTLPKNIPGTNLYGGLVQKHTGGGYKNIPPVGTNLYGGLVQKCTIDNKEIIKENNKDNNKEIAAAASEVDSEYSEIIRLFQDNIQIITSEIIQDQLNDLYDTYGYEWLKHAIHEAVISNGRSIKYIKAILERWHNVGNAKPWAVNQTKGNTKGRERMDEIKEMYKYFEELETNDG
jgi:DnaD/phage-associated family protein